MGASLGQDFEAEGASRFRVVFVYFFKLTEASLVTFDLVIWGKSFIQFRLP